MTSFSKNSPHKEVNYVRSLHIRYHILCIGRRFLIRSFIVSQNFYTSSDTFLFQQTTIYHQTMLAGLFLQQDSPLYQSSNYFQTKDLHRMGTSTAAFVLRRHVVTISHHVSRSTRCITKNHRVKSKIETWVHTAQLRQFHT